MAILFTALILLVILVNGWTDAPSAIAGCVSTRSMSPEGALCLSAVCNFAGAVGMAILSPRVAKTVFGIADFGQDANRALVSLCAALTAVILWATAAWFFGIPTSETHALLSGLTGAALATQKSVAAIGFAQWRSVLFGLLASTLLSCLAGLVLYSLVIRLLSSCGRRTVLRHFIHAQRVSAACSSLMHGAQDSQKFMGVYLLGLSLMGHGSGEEMADLPMPIVLLCASVMTLGTFLGGSRIIKKVGCDMTSLDAVSSSIADSASSATLSLCSLLGLPASTTHTKSCAMMGVGLRNPKGNDPRIVAELFGAWVFTFPVCAVLGFGLSFCFQWLMAF
ncbi:MAG: inorganic phosphate transporter [Clostridia bacterium]|nr:inorganic phosphate transporter [Clostridia bacterium]